ncbi:hypothetical protein CMEL01_01368 [Colletotrichum melonis]|uniref:Major facilitator superfamily (MFS) profile domain-containing protein n=1 Tax=Colletotrichum melonis TaxID=1209925 RepID=A0AAI9XZ88_9PEZI|nr:hypothetical protein CMEL01_01368 [Colletotrichum melonis]
MVSSALVVTLLACIASTCVFSLDVAIINSLNVMQSFQNCTVENLALFATILLCSNLKYRTDFELTPDLGGLNVTILYVGCVFAVPFAGFVLDKLGRRRGLMVGSAIALLGAILQASAQEKVQLLLGRFLLGISFIITGTGAPSWLMEVGPPKYREEITNAMVACLPITGMVGGIIYLGVYNKTSNWAWRAGLMADIVGPAIALLILPFAPESIRWLVAKDGADEAFEVLIKISQRNRNDPELLAEFQQIKQTVELEVQMRQRDSWKSLVSPARNFRRFLITVLTNVFFQTNGSNFLPYFLTIIIRGTGVTDTLTLLQANVGLTAWAALCSMFGVWMLLNYSYPPEILKYTQRARGVGVGQALGYLIGAGMSYAIPLAIQNISWRYYIINCLWNVPIFVVIWWLFPETKGKTLEEIDSIFDGSTAEPSKQVIEGVEDHLMGDVYRGVGSKAPKDPHG